MRIIILLLIFCFNSWVIAEDYYLLEPARQPLAMQKIANQEYLATQSGLYQRQGKYFELIYSFPEHIQQATFINSTLCSEMFSLNIKSDKITMGQPLKFTPGQNSRLQQNLNIKSKLYTYIPPEDYDGDGEQELLFKLNNRWQMGKLSSELVIRTMPIHFTEQISPPLLSINYGSHTFLYKKINNLWQKYKPSGEQPLTRAEVARLSPEELSWLRYEIGARHGKIFSNKSVQTKFSQKSWYKPNPRFSEAMLNKIEKDNIKLLYTLEEEKRRKGLKEEQEIDVP